MRRLFSTLTAFIGLVLAPAAMADELRDRFAAMPAIWSAKIAPDGKHIALGCNRQGTPAVCVVAIDNTDKAFPKVYLAGPGQTMYDFVWAGTDWLVTKVRYLDDLRSISNSLQYVQVSRAIAHNIVTDSASQLLRNSDFGLNLDLSIVQYAPPDMPGHILMRAMNYRKADQMYDTSVQAELSPGVPMLMDVDMSSGKAVQFRPKSPPSSKFLIGAEGSPLYRLDFSADRLNILSSEPKSASLITTLTRKAGEPQWFVTGLLTDGKKLLMEKDAANGGSDFSSYDLASGQRDTITLDAPAGTILTGWVYDGISDSIVGTWLKDDLNQQRFLDPALERLRAGLGRALPGKTLTIPSWSRDRSMAIIAAESAGEPQMFYLFDQKTRALSLIGSTRPMLQNLQLGSRIRVSYEARDGEKITAFLSLPPGKTQKDGPFPLLLMPHGGPRARDDASFDWWAAYYAQRGYAVMQPNFRGSSGYGADFIKKGAGEFGRKMVDDVVDAGRFLIKSGVAIEGSVCAVGASYGGYSALMVAVRGQGLVRCVVSWAAVTDPMGLIADRAKQAQGMVGDDGSTMAFWETYIGRGLDDAQKAAISPARRASQIKVPVLLFHGNKDVNVPYSQALFLKKELDATGSPVKLVTLDGQDHEINSTTVRTTFLTEMDAFLQTHLPLKP